MGKIIKTAIVTIFVALVLSGCGRTKPDSQPPIIQVTATPVVATPEPSPEPVPQILSMLNEYYSAHEEEEEYQIKTTASLVDSEDEKYEMDLVLDGDTKEEYGIANIIANTGSDSFSVCFPYANVLYNTPCSSSLIREVSESAVRALCEYQGIKDSESKVKEVIASYDGYDYTSIINIGEYAVMYIPEGILYCSELRAIKIDEFTGSVDISEYEDGTFDDLNAKLNERTKYHVRGTITNYKSGDYLISLYTQKCMRLTVELEDGGKVTMTQIPEELPISFVIGETYDFYGKTMFTLADTLLFNLQYAE